MQTPRLPSSVVASCVVLVAGCLLLPPTGFAEEESDAFIDVHMHFSNQLKSGQRGERRGPGRRSRQGRQGPEPFSEEDFVACADNMIAEMDRHGFQRVIVMPQPRTSGQPGFYAYEQILPAVRKYPDRLSLGGGGGTLNSMIHATPPSEVTAADRARFRKEALAVLNNGAKVLGEFAVLHVSLHEHHVFEEVDADHPLYLLLADIAAEHDVPVDIHMEAVVADTPTPENLRRISPKNPATLKANIPAFERLLEHNRKAKIVWQHMGWDNVGQMTIPLLRRMLTEHPNLYLGFKVEERPYQVGTRSPMPNRMVDRDGHLKPDWMEFFEEFPDRLLLSCDQFVGIPGRTERAPQYIEGTLGAVKQLPPDVRRQIARDNAIRLYHLE